MNEGDGGKDCEAGLREKRERGKEEREERKERGEKRGEKLEGNFLRHYFFDVGILT